MLQINDCHDRLFPEIETVLLHLQSLIVSQTNTASGKINSVFGQTHEIERILDQCREDKAGLEEQLENERQQEAEELRRQVGANKLQLQSLHSMGLERYRSLN